MNLEKMREAGRDIGFWFAPRAANVTVKIIIAPFIAEELLY